jgi:lipopolysaccharide export system permease protein
MLFHSSIRRELARSFGATLLVLITIVITMLLIRTLGLANRGSVNPQEILLVLTYTVLGRLPTVLTLALFVAIVSTLSRMYQDSEMVVWFSSGRSLGDFLQPVFRFAWPVLLAIMGLVLFVWPWANQQTDQLRQRYESRSDLERVEPGQFQESSSGRRVFFIDKDSAGSGTGRNVFISSMDAEGQESVTTARSGQIVTEGATQYLQLNHGQRVEQWTDANGPALQVSEFTEYRLQVGSTEGIGLGMGGLKSRSTWALIQEPTRPHLGELGWRLGMGLTALNFVLLALAVSAGNPRVGRSGNLIFLLFAFVFYYNLLNIGQGWVASGMVGLLPFMLVLHGGAMALALSWLSKRHFGWEWRDAWAQGKTQT